MARAAGERKRDRAGQGRARARADEDRDDEPYEDEDEDGSEAGRPLSGRAAGESGFLPEMLRRGLTLGFTGFFMTEEALRRALGDSVPRDWVEFVVEQSDRTRTEFLDRISKEFGRVLSALDPVEVARRLLDGQTLEVSARVRLSSSDGSKTRVESVRVTNRDDDAS